jgi:hypothetical protein
MEDTLILITEKEEIQISKDALSKHSGRQSLYCLRKKREVQISSLPRRANTP